jgi:polyvinyl alcohol dehydrogenase (cytochrome)
VRPCVEALEDRTVPSAVEVVSKNPNDWPMFNHNAQGTRYNPAETRLRADNVDDLQEVWRFETQGAISGTPAVVNNVVYAADSAGIVYAVNHDGTLKWQTALDVPALVGAKIAASPLVTNHTLVIGDLAGQIHGLDVDDGDLRWTIRPSAGNNFPNGHPFQAIFGHGTMVGNYVAFGVSSYELLLPAIDPTYPGFTFRGSVVLIDPADGDLIWQTFTVPEPAQNADGSFGPSGATVWGAPAYDRASNTIFVGTSNNYSLPTTDTSDALIALDASDGSIKWVSQKTGGDHWNFSFLPVDPNDPPDYDIGDSPQLYKLDGRLVVAAGQKSGFFHVVDAETGAEVVSPPVQYLPGGTLGGFHIDSAHANGVNYAPANYWFDPFSGGTPEKGAVFAISGDGGQEVWHFDTESPVIAGVAVANGVVYAQDIGGVFYALDADTGALLAQLTSGGQSSGPAISRGRIYLGAGDNLTTAIQNPFLVPTGGAIIALGVNEAPEVRAGGTEFVREGERFTRTGKFTDPDSRAWTATVNYGDGGGDEALDLRGKHTFKLSHTYDDPGVYRVTVTVTDDLGKVGTDSFLVVVLPRKQRGSHGGHGHGHGHDHDNQASRPMKAEGSGHFTDAAGGFVAEGRASHLGHFTHFGTLLLEPTDDPNVFAISGVTTYEAANGDQLYASLDGTLNVLTGEGSGIDTWVGGTGKFADASGTAYLTAQIFPDGTFTFELVGFVTF